MGCASSAATGEKDKDSRLVLCNNGEGDPERGTLGNEARQNDSALDLRSPQSVLSNGSTHEMFVFRNEASSMSCFEEVSSLWSTDGEPQPNDVENITIDVHEDFFNEFEDNFDECEDFAMDS